MNEKEILKVVMKMRKVTQEQLAKNMGYTGQGAIGRLLARGTGMRVDNLVRTLNELDCDLVVRDRFGKNEYVVDTKEDEVVSLREKIMEMQKRIDELEGK